MDVTIGGMHCDACVRRVRKALEGVPGVNVQDVKVGAAQVTVDPGAESLVLEAIRKAGYDAQAAT